MKEHKVCKVQELKTGEKKIFHINGTTIVLIKNEEHFFALKNVCPHQSAELGLGTVGGTNLPSETGKHQFGKKGEVIRCPWHNWEFDIKTGCSLHDPNQRVKRYEIRVHEDDVLVQFS